MNHVSNDPVKIADLLSSDRVSTYLVACDNNLDRALELYKWNIALSGALFEAIAIVEIVVRNELDRNLNKWGSLQGVDWMEIIPVDNRGKEDISKARSRTPRDQSHGKVLAELNFGFWRFLVAPRYLHSIWMPILSDSFPNLGGHAGARREQVEQKIQRVWFLRNRIGHHEPIFSRNVTRDVQSLNELLDWISPDVSLWALSQRRIEQILEIRPV